MKRINALIVLSLLGCLTVGAQENKQSQKTVIVPNTAPNENNQPENTSDKIVVTGLMESSFRPEVKEDTLHLPTVTDKGHVQSLGYSPLYWNSWSTWALHQGLNINLSASVFASFGKNAPKGAGFTQSISAMYAVPLTNKLSLAVGGYFENLSWSHDSYRDAGLSAMLSYRFNEHWEGYVYGQKSITDNMRRMPYQLYNISDVGDRLGVAMQYNFNPNVSIRMSVEHRWMPQQRGVYFDQYNYPPQMP